MLDFHLAVGFDHFILYWDESEEKFEKIKAGVLKPYIEAGIVTALRNKKDKHLGSSQLTAHKDAFRNHRQSTFFFARVDFDEFVYNAGVSLTQGMFSWSQGVLGAIWDGAEIR